MEILVNGSDDKDNELELIEEVMEENKFSDYHWLRTLEYWSFLWD